MTIAELAARDLLNIAQELSKSSSAFLLIESACRLDQTLDRSSLIAEWTNEHITREYNRRVELGIIYSPNVTSE